jgi:DeoR/GlpR family transcriptional regulator of sugar metabolism
MLDVERRQQIVTFIEQHDGATVVALSKQFGISEATVRRDLIYLSKRGLIERAHGGAAPRRHRQAQGFPEPPLLKRASLQAEEKHRIGLAAAKYVKDGDTVIIAGGTTTSEMIPHLADRRGLTVITNTLNIATLLAACPNVTVIVLGGVLRHSELSMLGLMMENALENLRADKLFIGTPAIHVDYGFSADDMAEVQSDQALMEVAREIIVLADHTKFGKIATIRVAPIKRVHRVITDSGVAAEDVETLRDQGVDVETV